MPHEETHPIRTRECDRRPSNPGAGQAERQSDHPLNDKRDQPPLGAERCILGPERLIEETLEIHER